mmetsp:Transcript_16927/g.40250  ORF Transcript_16927/g.40250 Transcript_16927/m.40250 type:complete len:310 (-) Transcript_16927:40-969(-)
MLPRQAQLQDARPAAARRPGAPARHGQEHDEPRLPSHLLPFTGKHTPERDESDGGRRFLRLVHSDVARLLHQSRGRGRRPIRRPARSRRALPGASKVPREVAAGQSGRAHQAHRGRPSGHEPSRAHRARAAAGRRLRHDHRRRLAQAPRPAADDGLPLATAQAGRRVHHRGHPHLAAAPVRPAEAGEQDDAHDGRALAERPPDPLAIHERGAAGIRQRVARGLPARRAAQLALHPLTDLRLLEAGEAEGARRAGSEGQPTCQHAVAPLRRRRGGHVGGRCQGAAESRPRMQVGKKGAARLPGAIVVFRV